MSAAHSGGRARPSLSARIGLHTLLLLFSTLMLAPFGVMLLVSLVPLPAFLARDFSPAHYSLQNYARTFAAVPFGLYYANSTLVAVSVTVLQILISSLAAFAFARLRFRGRDLIFLFYLATLMIPFPVTLIPNFLIVKGLGWYDSYLALIGPVLATLSIFVFQGAWNDFLWPLVVTTSEQVRTIPLGLASFVGQYSTAWDMLMAGSVIALLPVLLIYLVGQKWFVQGIALSGMGGR